MEVTDPAGLARLRAEARAIAALDVGGGAAIAARSAGRCVAALRALAPMHAPVGYVVRAAVRGGLRAAADWARPAFGASLSQADGKLLWLRRGDIVEWWMPDASLHALVAGAARTMHLAP